MAESIPSDIEFLTSLIPRIKAVPDDQKAWVKYELMQVVLKYMPGGPAEITRVRKRRAEQEREDQEQNGRERLRPEEE